MLAVPVFNMKGKQTGKVEIDPAQLGGRVRPRLLKQAIVAYTDHLRQDSARTKGKKDVEGSTRKLYRQKGTGNARMGQVRTPVRRGGGRAFAKRGPAAVKELPKKMRRLARDNAILAKIQRENVLIVDDLRCEQPKTKVFATMLSALGADRGAVVAMHERDANLFLSGRNIDRTEVRLVDDLNAYDILRREKLIFTRPAFEKIAGGGSAA
jgi:large subunit ribosomal protein L4